MKKYVPYLLLALPFFLLKITNIGIWLSDTNIYFYTGYQLLQGEVLYKDIFFTNFPLIPYISALYFLVTGGNIPLFFFTVTIEVIAAGFLIYLIVRRENSQNMALLTAAIYLYSFIILATSDHQTGVFLGSVFSLLSYYFLIIKQKPFLSGTFIALALLTKAYFLPIFISFLIFLFFERRSPKARSSSNETMEQWDNKKQSSRFALLTRTILLFLSGFTAATIIVLLPSLLTAPTDLMRDVFLYSLTRSQGIDKARIAYFFLTHEALFALLLFWNILMIYKRLLFGLISISSLLFFLLYQDIYYLYLNFCIPFLALSFPTLQSAIRQIFSLQKMLIPTILLGIIFLNLYLYISSQRTKQKIENITAITTVIINEKPQTLYGINSLTPALAYLTKTPLLDGIIDTNENIFRKGFLNKKSLTARAIEQNALLISNAAIYPNLGITYPLLGGIFDEQAVYKSCRLIGTFPVQPEGIENAINVFRCRNK